MGSLSEETGTQFFRVLMRRSAVASRKQEDVHVEEALRACGYPHGLSVKLDVR